MANANPTHPLELEVRRLRHELDELREMLATEVVTRRLVIVDQAGNERIVAGDGLEPGSAFLSVKDGTGQAAVTLFAEGVPGGPPAAGVAVEHGDETVIDLRSRTRTHLAGRRWGALELGGGGRLTAIEPGHLHLAGSLSDRGAYVDVDACDGAAGLILTTGERLVEAEGQAEVSLWADRARGDDPARAELHLVVDGDHEQAASLVREGEAA